MKKVLQIFILVLIAHQSFSQDTSKVFVKRLYLNAGITAIKLGNLPGGSTISVISELDKYYIIALRYYHAGYKDKDYPTPNDKICFGCPFHIINEYNLSLGKTINVNKYFTVTVTMGPSYVNYRRPENIKPQNNGGFFNLSLGYYDFDLVEYNLFGWSSRVDLNILPLRFLGLSVGGFYSYNAMQPAGGININLLLGKLRKKNITQNGK